MALHALGKVTVTTAGTPVIATTNATAPTDRLGANAILIEAWWANAGKIYICDRSNPVVATGVGVIAVLAPCTTNFIPSFSATLPYASGGLSVNDIWIDAETSADGVLVSYVAG